MMIGLRPTLSDSVPKKIKNGVPISSEMAIQRFAVGRVDLQGLGQEVESVELASIPNHGLSAVRPKSAINTILILSHRPNDSVNGALDPFPSAFISANIGRLSQLQPDTDGDTEQNERDEKWNAPAPFVERSPHHM